MKWKTTCHVSYKLQFMHDVHELFDLPTYILPPIMLRVTSLVKFSSNTHVLRHVLVYMSAHFKIKNCEKLYGSERVAFFHAWFISTTRPTPTSILRRDMRHPILDCSKRIPVQWAAPWNNHRLSEDILFLQRICSTICIFMLYRIICFGSYYKLIFNCQFYTKFQWNIRGRGEY
jgi:hypothetical protein